VGKTSTKDLAAAALSAQLRTVSSERSFNNELGLPLTLTNAPDETEVAVLEMGARGPGHIRLLCGYGRPTIGVVTAVAAAHTDAFGDLDGVARAKGELVEALPSHGCAVLNMDDARVAAMVPRTAASIIGYSTRTMDADVAADNVLIDDQLRPSFRVLSPWGEADVLLEARGVHQVANALAALAVAGACGVDIEAAAAALRRAPLSPWRMEVSRSRSGAVVINDAYNANPASMVAALDALASLPAYRRVAVVGLMAELGPQSEREHQTVAEVAQRLGIELVVVGTTEYGVEPVADLGEALTCLGGVGAGDAILVKASRVVGLERLAQILIES
jgi:UDP-N-acetylmuramoyl-tripeptide--D-alanyl-D-alanine ligase